MDSSFEDELRRVRETYQEYDFQNRYERHWSPGHAGNRMIAEERRQAVASMAGRFLDASPTVLDIGCGRGSVLLDLKGVAGDAPLRTYGVDILEDRLHEAQEWNGRGKFVLYKGDFLPFRDQAFDIVLLFTVLSSIENRALRARVCQEAWRVTANGGIVLVYDVRLPNPRNRHLHPIRRRDVDALFPTGQLHSRSITVVPPLARLVPTHLGLLYALLARVPALRSHRMSMVVKRSSSRV